MKLLRKIVIHRIAASWEVVADYLEYEPEDKQLIRKKKHDDPEGCCVELLEDWLYSDRGISPKSWIVLVNTLKEIKRLTATTEKIVKELSDAGIKIN